MIKIERSCPRCALVYASEKLDALCPACLLTHAFDHDEDEDETAFWEEEPAATSLGRTFSHFEIVEEIGRGGMGTVYRGRDLSTERIVALKVLQAHHLEDNELVQRFRSEVRAVTSLDHRHILPVHEVGEHNGVPFFSMKLASGGSLAQRLGEFLGQPRRAAQLLAKVARGMQHAHERGILHRDLKPGNILLDESGEPYVCDFGLAKWLSDDRRLTMTAAVLGTPHYIAPEQANGKDVLTIAADIYSLGAILYELLTGRPPFVGETVIETLRQASDSTPARPSSIVHHTPRDLETICLKCLEREPHARYANAAAVASDLENWIAGRPIRARPVSAFEQLWRWARRNPLPASLGVLLVLALTAFAVGATYAALKINTARARAVAAEQGAREQLYNALLAQARASRMTGLAGHRVEALKAIQQAAAIRPSLELRNEAIAALTLLDLEVTKKFKVRDHSSQPLAYDAALETVAVATVTGDIDLISLADGTIKQSIFGVGKPHLALCHSGTRFVAARCSDNNVYVWSLATGKRVGTFPSHPIPRQLGYFASDCVFSPDETLLALCIDNGICVVDVATGNEIARLDTVPPEHIAFDPAQRRLAFGHAKSRELTLWRFAETKTVETVRLPAEPTSLAWNEDGTRFAAGCSDFSIQIIDPVGWHLLGALQGHRQELTKVVFNRRGDMLASTARDRTISLWDLRTLSRLVELARHGSEPALGFSADGRLLCATDALTNVVMLRIEGVDRICTAFAPPVGKDQPVLSSTLVFTADSRYVASTSIHALQLFDVERAALLFTQSISPPTQTAINLIGSRTLAVLSHRTGLQKYEIQDENGTVKLLPQSDQPAFPGYVFGSAPHGAATRCCLVSPPQGTGIVWDPESDKTLCTLRDQPGIYGMAVSPDGQWIATTYRERNARIWSVGTAKIISELRGGRGGQVGFSPSGRWLACSGSGADHLLWQTGTWTAGPSLPPRVEAETGRFAFSEDETMLAAALGEQVCLVSLPNGTLLGFLEQRLQPIPYPRLCFSPDRSRLVTQGADNSLSFWNLDLLRTKLRELQLHWE